MKFIRFFLVSNKKIENLNDFNNIVRKRNINNELLNIHHSFTCLFFEKKHPFGYCAFFRIIFRCNVEKKMKFLFNVQYFIRLSSTWPIYQIRFEKELFHAGKLLKLQVVYLFGAFVMHGTFFNLTHTAIANRKQWQQLPFVGNAKIQTKNERKKCGTGTNMFQSKNCVLCNFRVGIWFLFETGLSRWVFFFGCWALNIENWELKTAADTFQFIMQTFHFIIWNIFATDWMNSLKITEDDQKWWIWKE